MSDDLHALAGLYALDALDDLEMQRFERHIAECDECRVEVAEFRDAAQRMAGVSQESPPSQLKTLVMADVARTPQVHLGTGVVGRAGRRRSRTAAMLFGAAASVVLVASLAVALVSTRSDLSDAQALSAVLADPLSTTVTYHGESGVVARLVGSSDGDRLVVLLGELPVIASDRAYELWLIGDAGAMPMGLVRPNDRGEATALIDAPIASFHTFGVTDEPAGGSPVATGPMIVSGPVTS